MEDKQAGDDGSNAEKLLRLVNALADNAELLRQCGAAFCNEHPDYKSAPMAAILRLGASPEVIAAIAVLVVLVSHEDDYAATIMASAMLAVGKAKLMGIAMPEERPTVRVPNSGVVE